MPKYTTYFKEILVLQLLDSLTIYLYDQGFLRKCKINRETFIVPFETSFSKDLQGKTYNFSIFNMRIIPKKKYLIFFFLLNRFIDVVKGTAKMKVSSSSNRKDSTRHDDGSDDGQETIADVPSAVPSASATSKSPSNTSSQQHQDLTNVPPLSSVSGAASKDSKSNPTPGATPDPSASSAGSTMPTLNAPQVPSANPATSSKPSKSQSSTTAASS